MPFKKIYQVQYLWWVQAGDRLASHVFWGRGFGGRPGEGPYSFGWIFKNSSFLQILDTSTYFSTKCLCYLLASIHIKE